MMHSPSRAALLSSCLRVHDKAMSVTASSKCLATLYWWTRPIRSPMASAPHDSYSFVIIEPVLAKLNFIHRVVHAARRGEVPMNSGPQE